MVLFSFNEDWHDFEPKTVLGTRIYNPSDGKADAEQVVRMLADHPSTARYVCTKLVRRLVADDPPESFVNAAVAAWQATDGDIKAIVRSILTHPEFDQAPPKYKRPFDLLVSIMRATNANYDGNYGLIERLQQMGQRPFNWVTPDGYPDVADLWYNNIFHYWKLEIDAANNNLPGANVDIWNIADHVDVDRNPNRNVALFWAVDAQARSE